MAEDNVIFDNKIYVASPALADGDGPILPFRKWAAQFYVARKIPAPATTA
jgi:3-Ketosteroid 9alpha-hydroxylase C-terminal domain